MQPLSLSTWAAAFFISASMFSHTVALRLLMLACCAGLAVVAIARDRTSIRLLPPIWFAFALWAAWAVLSLAWSVEPERTIKELRNEVGYTALALWACHIAAQARNATRVIPPVVAAAAVLLCAFAFYYFHRGDNSYPPRWHGGPGNLSSALLALMPCAVLAAWYGRRAGQRLLSLTGSALVVLLFAAAYTTLNRTIWIGFAAQLLLIGTLLAIRRQHAAAPGAKMVGITLAILVIASAALMAFQIHGARQRADATAALERDSRLRLWPEVLEHVKERPLTGYGFGRGMLRESLQREFNQTLLWHAHNLFLDSVLQGGLPGLLLLLLLLGATLRQGWRMSRSYDDLAAACGLAVLALVAGMVIRNMTDTLLVRQNALFYWGLLGILFAWSRTALVRVGDPRLREP